MVIFCDSVVNAGKGIMKAVAFGSCFDGDMEELQCGLTAGLTEITSELFELRREACRPFLHGRPAVKAIAGKAASKPAR